MSVLRVATDNLNLPQWTGLKPDRVPLRRAVESTAKRPAGADPVLTSDHRRRFADAEGVSLRTDVICAGRQIQG